MTAAIAISGVSKTYASGFAALKSVDLEIRQGEIFALLGPNGAGKTTLINILATLTTADSGTAIVAGHDALRATLEQAMHAAGCTLRYRELDPDIFGEELDRPAYADAGVERIAAIGAIATRGG